VTERSEVTIKPSERGSAVTERSEVTIRHDDTILIRPAV
jgi:hypothetical protein